MKIEIGKRYLTRNSRFVTIVSEPWKGIYNGDFDDDNRGDKFGRWLSDGTHHDFIFGHKVNFTVMDIIMEDCEEARDIWRSAKLERKLQAYAECP